jgi:hypothetical protein
MVLVPQKDGLGIAGHPWPRKQPNSFFFFCIIVDTIWIVDLK